MKYISMKMEPKGRMPVIAMITSGLLDHDLFEIGRGNMFTRHGNSALGAQCRAMKVPKTTRGQFTHINMPSNIKKVVKGITLMVE